jgi:hypothetical protein
VIVILRELALANSRRNVKFKHYVCKSETNRNRDKERSLEKTSSPSRYDVNVVLLAERVRISASSFSSRLMLSNNRALAS